MKKPEPKFRETKEQVVSARVSRKTYKILKDFRVNISATVTEHLDRIADQLRKN